MTFKTMVIYTGPFLLLVFLAVSPMFLVPEELNCKHLSEKKEAEMNVNILECAKLRDLKSCTIDYREIYCREDTYEWFD